MHAPWMPAIALAASLALAASPALADEPAGSVEHANVEHTNVEHPNVEPPNVEHPTIERPLIIPSGGASADALERVARARGLDVARPQREADVAAESALAEARPLYRDMAFGKAATRLQSAEDALLAGRLPTPRLAGALAEIELWLGACTLLDNKPADAHDHFALARALAPTARPDRIFPPEVHAAFAHTAPGASVRPHLLLSPPGARLWIDAKPAAATTSAGLHWIVVERADRQPVGRVMRVTQAAPEVAVDLPQPAAPDQALRQAAARAADGPLGSEEGLAVSAALGRTVWIVGERAADRFAAADAAHPERHVDYATDPIDAVCTVEPSCIAPPVPKKPIYKRAVLWVPIGIGVALAVGAGVLAGTLANSSSDYVVHIH